LFSAAAFISSLLLLASAIAWFIESALLRPFQVEANRMHSDARGSSRYELDGSGGGLAVRAFGDRALQQASQKQITSYMPEVARRPLIESRWQADYSYPASELDPNGKPTLGFLVFSHHFTWQGAVFTNYEYGVVVPCWSLVILFAILPTLWFIKHRKHGSPSSTQCAACGYNLTGNTSGVCPECGAPILAFGL